MRKKLWKKSAAAVLMLVVLSTGLVANAEGSYTVKEGDCLKKIAESSYGDPARWEDIYEANKDSVKNPDIIFKGQVLMLPDIDPVPAVDQEIINQTENQENTIQTADQGETVTTNNVMTLEQWVESEECKAIEEFMNEIMVEFGLIIEMKAEGNTFVIVYHFNPEFWGEMTAEEMADTDTSDMDDLTEGLPELVGELGQEFDATYGIKLDGIRYIFVATDGIPFYSMDMKYLPADK